MSLPWFQVGGVPDLLSSRIWAWPFFLSGKSQNSRWPEPRHPSSGPGMEVNLGLLTSALLCFKIFHSWAVEFLNQSGVGEDIYRLIHILPSGPSITNSLLTTNLSISFDFHSHNFFLPMLGRGTKHSVGIRMHLLARLTDTSPLGLTGCLLWEVKVVGSGRGLALTQSYVGRAQPGPSNLTCTNIMFSGSFFQAMITCACLCVSVHIKRASSVGMWTFKTTVWDGKHLSTCVLNLEASLKGKGLM